MKKQLTQRQANEIRILHGQGMKQVELAKKFDLDKSTVSKIVANKIYTENRVQFEFGEVEWENAQVDAYNPEFTKPPEHVERELRKAKCELLTSIIAVEQGFSDLEAKYGVDSGDIKMKIVSMPYCEETRQWYMAVLKRDRLLADYDDLEASSY